VKELEQLAETVKTKLDLNYDAESVKFIEGYIERIKTEFDLTEYQGLINAIGAFIGQCIIINYGGAWQLDPEGPHMCVAFDATNKVFPFSKTTKQFENGLEDSVYSFFTVIPTIFKFNSKPSINSSTLTKIPPKKQWWKFW
jgi:hypothetical protein